MGLFQHFLEHAQPDGLNGEMLRPKLFTSFIKHFLSGHHMRIASDSRKQSIMRSSALGQGCLQIWHSHSADRSCCWGGSLRACDTPIHWAKTSFLTAAAKGPALSVSDRMASEGATSKGRQRRAQSCCVFITSPSLRRAKDELKDLEPKRRLAKVAKAGRRRGGWRQHRLSVGPPHQGLSSHKKMRM